jgi:hypothetical protein
VLLVETGLVSVLVVDAANVVGSRPDGWWKDRPGAARRLHEELQVATAMCASCMPLGTEIRR